MSGQTIFGLPLLDAIALAFFVAAWLGYGTLHDAMIRKWQAVNSVLPNARRAWIYTMLGRENRITDASLLGQVVNSTTFFASTSMLLIGAVFGALAHMDSLRNALDALAYLPQAPRSVWEARFLLLAALLVQIFIKLTWTIRQLNYTIVMIGACPPPPVPPVRREEIADAVGLVLTLSLKSFNDALRGYHFVVAALGWFLGPIPFIVATLVIMWILLHRQFVSPNATAVRSAVDLLSIPRSADAKKVPPVQG